MSDRFNQPFWSSRAMGLYGVACFIVGCAWGLAVGLAIGLAIFGAQG